MIEYVELTTDVLLQATMGGAVNSLPLGVRRGDIVQVWNNLADGVIVSYRGCPAFAKNGVDFRRLSPIECLALAAN